MIHHQPFVQNPAGLQGSDLSEQAFVHQSNKQVRPRDDVFHESNSTWYQTPHHNGHHPGICHPWEDEQQAVLAHPCEDVHFPVMLLPCEHEQYHAMVHPWDYCHYQSMIDPLIHHPWDPCMDYHLVDYHHNCFHSWDYPHEHGPHPCDNLHW